MARIFIALAALLMIYPASASEPGLPGEGEASTGVRQTDEDSRSSKFGEYRDLEDGFVFDLLSYHRDWADKAWFLDFQGLNALRGDESYRLGFGLHGKFDVDLSYDRTPHLVSREGRTIMDADGSLLRIPGQIRSDFQALDDTTDATYVTGDTAGTVALAEQLIAAQSFQDIGVSRQKAAAGASWRVGKSWSLRFDASSELRTGTRPLGTGTYQRRATGAGAAHQMDQFRALGQELAAPIDERTSRIGVGVHFVHKRFMVDFGVEAVAFDNAFGDIRWDNPFRATDLASGTFRNRFSRGLIDSLPDNTATTASVTGSVDLPGRSRLSVLLSQTNSVQDDPFSPYTLNTAISAAAGFNVTNPKTLPGESLDGDVTTTHGSLLFTTHPIKPLSVTARYRLYDYKNDSEEFIFPGYAAFGESAWRTNIVGTVPIENHLYEYTRTNYGVDVTWRFVRQFALQAAVGRESWDRVERAVETTDEDIAGLTVMVDPADWLSFRAGFRAQSREFDGAYDPELEDPDLRQFDQANRDRDAQSLQVQITPTDRVSIGLAYDVRKDDYPDSPRGLQEAKGTVTGIDVTVSATDRVSFYVLGGFDKMESDLLSVAKDDDPDGAGPLTNYLPENEWTAGVTDEMTEVGAGVKVVFKPDRFDADLSLTRTEGDTDFENNNPINRLIVKSVQFLNSRAVDWPRVHTETTAGDLKLRYWFRPGVALGVRWLYEDYGLDDFARTPVRPYMFNQVNLGRGLDEARRFLFLDSTYGDYKGSVISAMMQYRF